MTTPASRKTHLGLALFVAFVLAALSVRAVANADSDPVDRRHAPGVSRVDVALGCVSDLSCLFEAMVPAGAGPRWDSGYRR